MKRALIVLLIVLIGCQPVAHGEELAILLPLCMENGLPRYLIVTNAADDAFVLTYQDTNGSIMLRSGWLRYGAVQLSADTLKIGEGTCPQ